MAVATTKFAIHTNAIVAKFGWEKYFTVLASGDDVSRVKPAPDLLLWTMEKLGAEPGETVMIGDTENDILAAQAAGIKVIAVKSPFGHNSFDQYNPDCILDSVSDIPDLFNA
jgi:phosphoglycolate phosphatase